VQLLQNLLPAGLFKAGSNSSTFNIWRLLYLIVIIVKHLHKELKMMPDDCCLHCSYALFEQDDIGICRRYPPSVILEDEDLSCTHPLILHEDWCGEFKRKVN
jgi:hypothetical protein